MQFGSLNGPAHELRVGRWIDVNGDPMADPLQLTGLGDGYKIIYAFQRWCPGCHSLGFPTLKYLHDNLKDKGSALPRSRQSLKGPRSTRSTSYASIRNNTA